MIDSEIIDGELTGVIEPDSRAHVVLKAATGMLMIKKLTAVRVGQLVVSDVEFRAYLRNSEVKANEAELQVLVNYGLLEKTFYYEKWEERETRQKLGIKEAEYSEYTRVWRLGEFTSEVLQMLKDGDEAHVYC
jgi:hypothetical protein